MSFITATPLGGYNNENFFLGPVPISGGNFQPAVAVPAGDVVLVAVVLKGGTSVADAALTVVDSQSNTYTLLGQIAGGGGLLAVFGSELTTGIGEEDYIAFDMNSGYNAVAVGVQAHNVSLTVDFVETNTGSGANPPALASGTPDATYGDGIFGFTAAYLGFAFPPGFTGVTGWDTPVTTSYDPSLTESGDIFTVFGSETFSRSAQSYAPTFGQSASYGQIVLGLRAVNISGTFETTENTDHSRFIGVTEADPVPPLPSGPFFFAYVDDDSVAFDPDVHNVVDEDIFSFDIKHDEGQVPTLTLTIENPRVGLLNPGRKLWAYLSYQPEDPAQPIVPIFFGVLVGIPTDMFAELVTLQFNARPVNYIEAKQAVAETMKVVPFYDPVFLDLTKRDDPDAILEGWSSLYHIDRVTLDVSASDILEGEDGTIEFDETMGIYDSVKMQLGECPLYTVQVQADVKWTQRCIGYLQGPPANITTYTGASFKADWPKPGANLGGGWKCESSFVDDVLDTDHARMFSTSSNWKNSDPDAGDCSTATMSYSATYSAWPGISIEGTGARSSQTGVCDPYAYPSSSATVPGVNIPAKVATSGSIALEWILNCSWTVRYDAKRDFTETCVINVTANLQNTFVSPTVDQSTELIKVTGADVGQPLETPYAWSDFIEQEVPIATLIFPNDPTTPGGTSYQMCVGSGTAGSQEPVFSDIPGTITLDGSVRWASLGESPPETQPEWTNSTPVGVGEIMVVEPKVFSIETGDMETTGASYFFLCVSGGFTNGAYTTFEYIPAAQSSDDGPAKPVPFAVILGPGDSAFSNIGGGGTGANISGVGGETEDGSVVWVNLGTSPPYLGIPIGGTMTNVTARSYFPTDRGVQSLQYLICKARARLRLRSRAVKIDFDAPFEDCLALSCRKNATLLDPRIPGGAATGKITSYTLSADKDGKLIGHVEIGVAVGQANSVSEITGTPTYCVGTGYVETGYQAYTGGQYTTAEEDIAYTPPVFAPYDDGLSFPLQSFPGTLTITHPIQSAQVAELLAQATSPQLGNVPAVTKALGSPGAGGSQTTILQNQTAVDWLEGGEGTYLIECDPVAAEVLIQPVTNGPFNGAYFIDVTELEIPKGIDLGAASSP